MCRVLFVYENYIYRFYLPIIERDFGTFWRVSIVTHSEISAKNMLLKKFKNYLQYPLLVQTLGIYTPVRQSVPCIVYDER